MDSLNWVTFGANIDKSERYFCPKCNILAGIVSEDKILKFKELSFMLENMFSDIFDLENVISRVLKDSNPWKSSSLKYSASRPMIVSKCFNVTREAGGKKSSLFPVKSISRRRGPPDRNSDGSVLKELFCILSDNRYWNLEIFSSASSFRLLSDKSSM